MCVAPAWRSLIQSTAHMQRHSTPHGVRNWSGTTQKLQAEECNNRTVRQSDHPVLGGAYRRLFFKVQGLCPGLDHDNLQIALGDASVQIDLVTHNKNLLRWKHAREQERRQG